jgi:methyl-accepting chemotaxis protein
MHFLDTLGLKTKIFLPFLIAIISVLLVGALSVSTSRNLVSATDHIAENLLPSVSETLNEDRDLYQALVAQISYVDSLEEDESGERW